jgi:hypothetical protein
MPFIIFLFYTCGSSGGVLPVKTDWEKEHVKGKVKSITTQYFDVDSSGAAVDSAAWNNPDMVNLETKYYNPQGFITEISSGDGVSAPKIKQTYTYNTSNRILKIENTMPDDMGKNTSEYIYNRRGQLVKLIDHTEYVYNGQKQQFKTVYTSVKFDAQGNILKSKAKTENKSKDYYLVSTYNPMGKRTQAAYYNMQDERISLVEYTYDASGNLLTEMKTDANHAPDEKKFTYDSQGNLLSETYTAEINGRPRLVKNEFVYVFDAQGNWVKRTTIKEGVKVRLTRRIIQYYQ